MVKHKAVGFSDGAPVVEAWRPLSTWEVFRVILYERY